MSTSMLEGAFYAGGLFRTAGFMMIFYVACKRFMEGWRSVKIGRGSIKQ